MKMQKIRTGNCLLDAASIILDIDPNKLAHEIGHNGKERWWPDLKSPYDQRGYHIQEIIDVMYRHGKLMCPIESMPTLSAQGIDEEDALPIMLESDAMRRLIAYMHAYKAILIGMPYYLTVELHAVAWDLKTIIDPNGPTYTLNRFDIREAWIIIGL